MRPLTTSLVFTAALLCAACGASKPEPEIASSAAEGGYAASYPDDIQLTAAAFSNDQVAIKQVAHELPKYPDELNEPDWDKVREIVQAADRAGRSQAYVDRLREVEGAKRFFEAKKDEITRKAAGAAQYAAKQKSCDVDVGGPVAHSIRETVDKELEKHLRESNEAHALIGRYREALGKDNVSALERQADTIARGAYLAHIDIVEQKLKLRRMIDEAEAVKRTSDDFVAAERKFQAEPKRTEAEKKASADRIEAMSKSKAMLDASVTQAKGMSDGMEDRIAASQKEYDDAVAKLVADLESRAKR